MIGFFYRARISRFGPCLPILCGPPLPLECNVRSARRLGCADLNSGVGPASKQAKRAGRDSGALSTSASQAEVAPTWKEEVNRRLAAHQNRKGPVLAQPAVPVQHGASNLAAQAAARVAARYAKAPSYSDMLADEARAAVRAAEAASRAALHAQAAAESVLAGLEAASSAESEPQWEPEGFRSPAPEQAPAQAWEPAQSPAPSSPDSAAQSFDIRWEPDLPVRPAAPPAARASRATEASATFADDWWNAPSPAQDAVQMVEPAQPIHANLIEFPREIVAPRKVRPRLAEGPLASPGAPDGQLSIFEVDPETISTQPAVAEIAIAPPIPEWSDIELDAQPLQESVPHVQTAPAAASRQQAPMTQRLLAAVVDGSLIAGAFLLAVTGAASYGMDLPGIREMEIAAAAALLIVAFLYQVLFFTLGEATPGMKYARLSLCTFDNRRPTRAQRCGRLGAFLLSLLPLGLGVAWSLFDENHLSWHDRISRTYLRKCY